MLGNLQYRIGLVKKLRLSSDPDMKGVRCMAEKQLKKPPRILVFFGLLAVILVPTAFTVIGWQTLRLECARTAPGAAPSCEVRNGYFFGIIKTSPRRIEKVTNAGYGSSSLSTTGRASRTIVSTIVLGNDSEHIPVFETSSNVNDGKKREVLTQVDSFLKDEARLELKIQTRFSNIFGWIGLPLFAAIVLSVLYSLFKYALQAIRKVI